MPRTWVAHEYDDPTEKEGGSSHDYCSTCYEDALHEWWDLCEMKADDGHFDDPDQDIYEIVVDHDEHPDYDDGDHTCETCGTPLNEKRDR